MSTTGASEAAASSPLTAPTALLFTMRPSATTRRRSPLLLFAALPFVLADVQFTSPLAGAVLPVGLLNVAWKESGRQPYIPELAAYTLNLVVGGNEENNTVRRLNAKAHGTDTLHRTWELTEAGQLTLFNFVSGGTFINSSVSRTIPATISGPVRNGL